MLRRARTTMLIILTAALACLLPLPATQAEEVETARVPVADGFDFPVGKPDGEGFYKSRGFRANGHLGDDWNGGPGDSDLGLPVYNIGNGIVILARDIRMGWGNTVVVRHAYVENGAITYVDSLYAHLDRIVVREGQKIPKGHQVGTIGNGRGMYDAHLHLEIRKDIRVGLYTAQYPRDERSYWSPTAFITARRKLSRFPAVASVPINTYSVPNQAGSTVSRGRSFRFPSAQPSPTPETVLRRGPYKVNRFEGWTF